jgi:hypothetical protein
MVGRLLDKYGAGVLISLASAVAGTCAVGLAASASVDSSLCIPGRMAFASPSNWRHPALVTGLSGVALALALYGVTQGTGLAAMPLIAQWLVLAGDESGVATRGSLL